MNKKNILVFPCGSEVGLEIYRSLQYSTHVNLIGGNSVDDHGKFMYRKYIGNIPDVSDKSFISTIVDIIKNYEIDAIYPAMDSVIDILKQNERKIGCKVISSNSTTTEICLSKSKTYHKLAGIIEVPGVYNTTDEISEYPVFLKPDIGYGSRGTKIAYNVSEANVHQNAFDNILILEYLPGKEYTVDCFTNFNGDLLFVGPRERKRIANGISVNTSTMPMEDRFLEIAKKINEHISFNGAWFFQVKERNDGSLVLMEMAARLAGSSSVYRMKGINFALLSVFNAFEIPVSIIPNDGEVEMDRALNCKFKISINYEHVYLDLDDVVIVDGKVNTEMVTAIYQFINNNKIIHLITKHKHNLYSTLKDFRLEVLFDEIIHLEETDNKWKYIKHSNSIFIDDSFAERKEVKDNLNLPVFSPDMINFIK